MNIRGKDVKISFPLLGLFITLIGAAISAAVWASDKHAEIRSDMAEEAFMVETRAKDAYVPKHEFSRIEECIENQKVQTKQLSDKVEKMDSKLDDLHEVLIRQATVQEIRQIQNRARYTE